MRKLCFVKDPNSDKLEVSDLEIETERLYKGFSLAQAIMEEIDKEPVDIYCQGEVIGQVIGYKIVRNSLEYITEYFNV
jgi:hypothetical protein